MQVVVIRNSIHIVQNHDNCLFAPKGLDGKPNYYGVC